MEEETGERKVKIETIAVAAQRVLKDQHFGFSGSSMSHVTRKGSFADRRECELFSRVRCERPRSRSISAPLCEESLESAADRISALSSLKDDGEVGSSSSSCGSFFGL